MGGNLFDIVLYSSFIGSITALCIILLRFLTRKIFCKQYHYYLWIIFAIRLIFPMSIPSDISIYNVFSDYQLKESSKHFVDITSVVKSTNNFTTSSTLKLNVQESENETLIINEEYVDENKTKNAEYNNINKNSDIIEGIWLIGVVAMLFIYGTTYILTIKKAKKSNEVSENIKEILMESKKKARIDFAVNICENNYFSSPCVIGVFTPTIIVQNKITDCLNDDEFELILLHEIVHIKRKDNFINLFLMILMCVYWFNPLFWFCLKLIRNDCEISCDEKVLNIIGIKKSRNYAQTLLDTVILTNRYEKLSFNLFFAKSNTKERIRNIMQYKKKSMYIFIIFILVLVVAGVVLLTDKSKNVAAEAKVINISRHPEVADYTVMRSEITKLPEIKDENFEFDIRSADISSDNVTNRLDDLLHTTYDSKTKWPDKLPDGFNPKKIMELYKNPGLNIRELHKQNITGKGVGIAIIDQTLLVDHVEYKDRIKLYEESEDSKASDAAMHGSAVASIAVGKTVGVAPESDLYYIAGDLGTYDANNNFKYDFKLLAHDIDRILEINKSLPKENKIRVISASIGWSSGQEGYAEVNAAVDRAKAEGILVVSSSLDDTYGFRFHGLGKVPISDADDFNSYRPGSWWKKDISYVLSRNTLMAPMDFRCTAAPNGTEDYAVYSSGGWSWTIPYIAGVYALACQVKPEITYDEFWKIALETGVSINLKNDYGKEYEFKKIINPVGIIEKLKK